MEFIKIENKKTWVLNSIPQHFPGTKKYIDFWRTEKQKCIEGMWGPDFDGYRYMPPNIYFYCNYVIITDTDEDQNVMIEIKPELRDLEWELSYAWMEARGFSGFELDEYYSCDLKLKKYLESEIKTGLNIHSSWLKGDGTLKTFKPAREVLRQLHSQPLGRPLYRNNAKNIMVLGSRGGGKMLDINELCKIEDGWKKMKDLRIGEKVYGSDGKLTTIKNKSDIELKEFYKITLRDGRTIDACEDHSWKVWSKNKNKNSKTKDVYNVMTTKEMFNNYYYNRIDSKHKSKYNEIKYTKEYTLALPVNKVIEQTEKNLPIDPYLLGLLLGDGCLINAVSLTSADDEIIQYIINYAEKSNYTTRINTKENHKEIFITNKNKEEKSIKDLLKSLNLLGTKSNSKFIPEIYKNASENQRLELLKGLMDTDGFSDNRHIEYYTCSQKLSKDTEDLIRSLGISCKTTIKKTSYKNINDNKIDGQDCYRTSIYTDNTIFKLPRKLEYLKHIKSKAGRSKYDKTFITNIEPIGLKEGLCIEVDNEDHTYITKDFIVTHNSFFTAGAIILHELIFDGKKYYDTKNPEGGLKTKTSVFVGAAQSTYSSDILEKVSSAMNALAINPNLGIYGNPTNPIESNYTPNPFYKNMRGSLQPNNKKSPWVHKYEKKVRGKWIDGFGTNAKLFHGIYSAENPQAAAGTRPSVLVIEEVGLLENLITPHQSNEAAQTIGSKRIGSAIYIGTAGNMEKIRESREVFTDPDSYSMLEYNDDWEHSGKIGFFLPAYYTNKDFKDDNGNTDVDKAKQYYLDRRDKARKASNPKVYEGELMNYPIVPSEMFIGRTGNILPVAELKEVEKKLIKNNIYQRIGTPIDIFYDSTQPHGVDYKVIPDKRPLFEYPIPKNADIEGCITMYEAPIYVNGIVPNDLYNLVGYDPYVSENLDEGESLGSVYIMKNPKYLSHGYGGNEIVAGYVGKHAYGTNAYNENVEKLLMLYGSPYKGLWFEADRGKHVKSFFENKHKLHLLCLRPQKEMNTSVVAKKVANYGWITGSKINKIQLIDMLADWLKEETEINGIKKRNLERIPDIGLVRELQAFQLEKGNYDRVMALVGCVLGLRETENLYKQSTIEKHNPLSILVANKHFKTSKDVKKYRTKV